MNIYILLIICTSQISSALKPKAFLFDYSSFMIPHPDKAYRGGEDAFYASSRLLVVADGVGGWNSMGIDPALYSRFLCAAAEVYFNEDPQFYSEHPVELIAQSAKFNRNAGSSTMTVVTLDKSELRTCTIGDCKVLVIRFYKEVPIIIFESVEQQHSFNFPFQLAMNQYDGDNPYSAICTSITIQNNDLVILGSDGLFDNVYPLEILHLIKSYSQKGKLFQEFPKVVAKLAISRGDNPKFVSPFQSKAKQLGIKFRGGKLDDTTIILAKIKVKSSEAEESRSKEL